jgi:hypothetical protein
MFKDASSSDGLRVSLQRLRQAHQRMLERKSRDQCVAAPGKDQMARTFKPKMPSSKFGRAFARRAVKVDAVLGSANPKAFGNDICFYI